MYTIIDDQGYTYLQTDNLFEAERMLTRCINEGIDAYLV